MISSYEQTKSIKFLGIKSDPLIKKMINLLMRDGKRTKAENILNKALQSLDRDYPGRAIHIFYLGIIAVRQDIGVRLKPKPKTRRNKQSFNVYLPRVISPICGLNLGMRLLLKSSREQSTLSPLWENLSKELLKASQNKGKVVSKRYSLNKLAISNKRRVHFGVRY
uniref:ribosomal protein S7 n=1 Tax=Macrocystis pyrifera TaxID=35122 RepID=UPI0021148EE8|nr:ribosomal protein S7 [Macrocystis pyrifera]UTJ90687.1 ribosomal protein S7 [Macrocystis pyrifera]WJW71296.1 ribosomal protein S7 [Macrocystis pyrifera]